MGVKPLPHELGVPFWSREAVEEELPEDSWGTAKNTNEVANPNGDLKVWEGKNLRMRICCGGSSPFLWTAQGDAAAELEDDDERCGGGGAWATEGLRERQKTMEKWGEWRKASRAYL